MSIYIYMYVYIYIFHFVRGFSGSFSMLFSEAPASCDKRNFEIIFAALYFYFYELKKRVSHF